MWQKRCKLYFRWAKGPSRLRFQQYLSNLTISLLSRPCLRWVRWPNIYKNIGANIKVDIGANIWEDFLANIWPDASCSPVQPLQTGSLMKQNLSQNDLNRLPFQIEMTRCWMWGTSARCWASWRNRRSPRRSPAMTWTSWLTLSWLLRCIIDGDDDGGTQVRLAQRSLSSTSAAHSGKPRAKR